MGPLAIVHKVRFLFLFESWSKSRFYTEYKATALHKARVQKLSFKKIYQDFVMSQQKTQKNTPLSHAQTSATWTHITEFSDSLKVLLQSAIFYSVKTKQPANQIGSVTWLAILRWLLVLKTVNSIKTMQKWNMCDASCISLWSFSPKMVWSAKASGAKLWLRCMQIT